MHKPTCGEAFVIQPLQNDGRGSRDEMNACRIWKAREDQSPTNADMVWPRLREPRPYQWFCASAIGDINLPNPARLQIWPISLFEQKTGGTLLVPANCYFLWR